MIWLSLNRTSVELKLVHELFNLELRFSLNRTTVELKLRLRHCR